jgi:hypothetical protein
MTPFTEELEYVYAVWERGVKQQGREQAMRENIVALYQARFGAVLEELRALIMHIRGEDALLRILIATGTRAAEDVNATVREVVHDILRQNAGRGLNRGARYHARRGPEIR